MRHIWTLRPGFYTEFRYKSREHSGLAWGAIFGKVTKYKEMHTFAKQGMSEISRNVKLSEIKAPAGAT